MKYLNRFKDMREDRDLKLKDIAKVLGTSAQYYHKYEKGTRPITVERLNILADFYGTSVDYLLGRTDQKEPYPKSNREILE